MVINLPPHNAKIHVAQIIIESLLSKPGDARFPHNFNNIINNITIVTCCCEGDMIWLTNEYKAIQDSYTIPD